MTCASPSDNAEPREAHARHEWLRPALAGPVLAVAGWKSSGKTTLLERVIPPLRERGLHIAVLKHDAHGIEVDRTGRDSDRLFRAGAEVLLGGPGEVVSRRRPREGDSITRRLTELAERADLVIVEGHKGTPLPKVWLERAPGDRPPEAGAPLLELPPGEGREEALLDFIDHWLPAAWREAPVRGCVLVGGRSRRMGRPKHLLEREGRTLLERAAELLEEVTGAPAVISGAGDLPAALAGAPRLADVPGARGPLSGLLAVLRWAPGTSWLVAPCDLPALERGALEWLLERRRPGVWATLPRRGEGGRVEPLLALYNGRSRGLLEALLERGELSLQPLAKQEEVETPRVPVELASAWQSVNTPEDLERHDITRA